MRRRKMTAFLIACAMGCTLEIGCGQTMRLTLLNDLYGLATSLIYQLILGAVTGTADPNAAVT